MYDVNLAEDARSDAKVTATERKLIDFENFDNLDLNELYNSKMKGKFKQSYQKANLCSKLMFEYGKVIVSSVRENKNEMTVDMIEDFE